MSASKVGYSARDWCTPDSPSMSAVVPFSRYSGGRTFSTDDAASLLEAFQDYPDCMDTLLKDKVVGQIRYLKRPHEQEGSTCMASRSIVWRLIYVSSPDMSFNGAYCRDGKVWILVKVAQNWGHMPQLWRTSAP